MIMNKLLSPDDVAEVLQITPKIVRQYINQGLIKAMKVGKFWRIEQEDLQDFINQAKIARQKEIDEQVKA